MNELQTLLRWADGATRSAVNRVAMGARACCQISLRAVHFTWLAACLCGPSVAGDTLPWFDQQGPTTAARQAIEKLAGANADGLDAADYDVDWLRQQIETSADAGGLTAEAVVSLNAAFATAVRRYLSDLHYGRVQPRQVGIRYADSRPRESPADHLPIEEQAALATPRWPEYEELRQALASYLALAEHPAWAQDLPPLPGSKLTPGQHYAGLTLLSERLVALGDLPPQTEPAARYEGSLVDGVKSFQERHGLTPDGVIGKESFEQLKGTPQARAEQLGLALERLRWTPLPRAGRVIVVNVPEFMLHAYRVQDEEIVSGPSMRVVVGNAHKSRTPIFTAPMRTIEFNPYWNIPPSIMRDETLPKLQRDPNYFERQGYELVGSDGRVMNSLPEGGLEAVSQGQMRIRQRPGTGNALGDMKFVFPNSDNIYLHYTPTPHLFKRDRRDFSHGCIRVEAPVELAEFVLAGDAEWPRNRIVQAKKSGRSMNVRLKEERQVVIAYSTATVRNGRVHFFADIYGYDRTLREALRQRSAALQQQTARMTSVALKAQP